MIETITTWLLLAALFYLLATSVILIRNRIGLRPLPESRRPEEAAPSISLCIPARNEEINIESVVRSSCSQEYPDFEVIVLDDGSDDRTPDLLAGLKVEYSGKLNVINGKPLPDGWLGKPWACLQLSETAGGEILLFLDADTTLEQGALKRIAAGFEDERVDMLTVWPVQILNSFWERTVLPLVYYLLVTNLPAVYASRPPRWMPGIFRRRTAHWFAAACGQCIAFRAASYHRIGGHASVRHEVVEDVALARTARRYGLKMAMFTGIGTIRCRMYRSGEELTAGLRKNFLAGFHGSATLLLLASLFHLTIFVLPFVILPVSVLTGNAAWFFLSAASAGLILLHRLILSLWFHWNPIYAFTHPLAVLWFQRLGILTLTDKITGRGATWKGRRL